MFIVQDLDAAAIESIRRTLAELPADAAARRIGASRPLLPTRCWLNQRMPSAPQGGIELEAWLVQPRRLPRSRTTGGRA